MPGIFGFSAFADIWGPSIYDLPLLLNDLWNQAKSWILPRRDPLAFDLDGDGIETRGADGRVVFDHNNDGIKTGTGWLRFDKVLMCACLLLRLSGVFGRRL